MVQAKKFNKNIDTEKRKSEQVSILQSEIQSLKKKL